MKLTEGALRRIIREEIGILLEREYYYRYDVNSKIVYHGDDEGNEVPTDKSPDSVGIYVDEDGNVDENDLVVPTDVPPRSGYGGGGRGSYGGYGGDSYGRRRRYDDDGWSRGGFYDRGGSRGRY